MNHLAQNRIPFLFILDSEGSESMVLPKDQIDQKQILYRLKNHSNSEYSIHQNQKVIEKTYPVDFDTYREKFESIQKEILYGNSYLVNLSFRSKIELNFGLKDIFNLSNSPYKLFIRDKLVLFSPESFVRIKGNYIYTYPMKGTMVKENEKTREVLLNDYKESAEHATITDLLRNDLSYVAGNVRVNRYRYIDEIKTGNKTILQVSSEISGKLLPSFKNKPGDIMAQILPAGSVTGAPKKKTLEIIKQVENYNRGFYTGVFGFFDGKSLDSAVMIRFIEKEDDQYYYKSGGGITFMSDCEKEYQELIDKIYVPVS